MNPRTSLIGTNASSPRDLKQTETMQNLTNQIFVVLAFHTWMGTAKEDQ